MAWKTGQKTKSSILWMTNDDILAFSNMLHTYMPEIVFQPYFSRKEEFEFYKKNHSPSVTSLYDILMNKNKNQLISQACVCLPTNDPWGLLLFNYSRKYPHICRPTEDFNAYTDISLYPKEFYYVKDSSLAIRWNTLDRNNNPNLCALIDQQVKQIWKLLNKVTKSVKCYEIITGNSRSSPNYRIGKYMYELVKQNNWHIQQGQFFKID